MTAIAAIDKALKEAEAWQQAGNGLATTAVDKAAVGMTLLYELSAARCEQTYTKRERRE